MQDCQNYDTHPIPSLNMLANCPAATQDFIIWMCYHNQNIFTHFLTPLRVIKTCALIPSLVFRAPLNSKHNRLLNKKAEG